MLNWVLQLVFRFDKFDGIFIFNSLDLKYKKLNCSVEHQKFLICWGTVTKILAFCKKKIKGRGTKDNMPLFFKTIAIVSIALFFCIFGKF